MPNEARLRHLRYALDAVAVKPGVVTIFVAEVRIRIDVDRAGREVGHLYVAVRTIERTEIRRPMKIDLHQLRAGERDELTRKPVSLTEM